MCKHTALIKLFSEVPISLKGDEFHVITFPTFSVRKETNLPLEVLAMFIGFVTLVLVR